jgi:hypothetical protein
MAGHPQYFPDLSAEKGPDKESHFTDKEKEVLAPRSLKSVVILKVSPKKNDTKQVREGGR